MKDFLLGTKQAFSFGLILLIMASANIFTITQMFNLRSETEEVSKRNLPIITTLEEINTAIENFRIFQLQHAITSSAGEKKEYTIKIDSIGKLVEKHQKDYFKYVSSPSEKNAFTTIMRKWDSYTERNEQFIKISNNGMSDEAVYMLNYASSGIYKSIIGELKELIVVRRQMAMETANRAEDTYLSTTKIIVVLFVIVFAFSLFMMYYLTQIIIVPIRLIDRAAKKITEGDSSVRLSIKGNDEIGRLADSFNAMAISISTMKNDNALNDWLKTGENGLNQQMRGDIDTNTLAKNVITYLAKYIDAQIGALYLWDDNQQALKLASSYAYVIRKQQVGFVQLGEGFVGQAAVEKDIILFTNIPQDYIVVHSALGSTPPKNIIVVPFMVENVLAGVIELGKLNEFAIRELNFLRKVSETVAITFYSAESRNKINYLLEQTQKQKEILQRQQAELKRSNKELEDQTTALKLSEMKLKEQQEELQTANEELEEKTKYLEEQKNEISAKNNELELARHDIERKAQQLEITSRYKSEFLANMSHELRTPLNSLLILARNLSENKEQNLTAEQVESSTIIYKSGNDLLQLINEILDLSKIESGKMNILIEKFPLSDIVEEIKDTFSHMVEEKGLLLKIQTQSSQITELETDRQRIVQILKNLLSNAIKFTNKGSITLDFFIPSKDLEFQTIERLPEEMLGISVTDTGIGIPEDKLKSIFEAFQQADGSTSRKYGGTGLGLTISRELARLLGGEIHLKSQQNQGSTFTVFIPFHQKIEAKAKPQNLVLDKSRSKTKPVLPLDTLTQTQAILIIEDDRTFAKILYEQCKTKGFEAIVCHSGEEGLEFLKTKKPSAVMLDLKLPQMSGWEVLEYIKNGEALQNVPVHIMSVDNVQDDALHKGAISFLNKPVQKEDLERVFEHIKAVIQRNIKNLLLVEDNRELRRCTAELITNDDVKIWEADTGTKALDLIRTHTFDCLVLDIGLPDMTGFELLTTLNQEQNVHIPPVIIYTGRELSLEEELELKKYSESIVIKGLKSEKRLLDETALFLHRMVGTVPQKIQHRVIDLHQKDSVLIDKKILLVDDDMRNSFALTKILKEKGIKIGIAENGQKALDILQKESDFDLILMDIMMPIMDGYETMRRIRQHKETMNLPIIALTAKAMKDDRAKCIAAGANDYLSKPIDIDQLFSMMRVWLY